jgi:hypothetical protein
MPEIWSFLMRKSAGNQWNQSKREFMWDITSKAVGVQIPKSWGTHIPLPCTPTWSYIIFLPCWVSVLLWFSPFLFFSLFSIWKWNAYSVPFYLGSI